MNVIRLERVGEVWRTPELGLDLPAPPPDLRPGWMVLRPERLRLLASRKPGRPAFDATMFNDYVLGSRTQVHLRRDGRTYIAELSAGTALPRPGERVRLAFDPADLVRRFEDELALLGRLAE